MKLPVLLLILFYFVEQANCSIPYYYEIGTAISGASLGLAVPHYMIFKTHHNLLDFVQLVYLFRLLYTTAAVSLFSDYLTNSWITFVPTFWSSLCSGTEFLCIAGYSASFGTCLTGVILILYVGFLVERCRKPGILFMPVFNFFKGFIRWIFVSLNYVAVYCILNYLINSTGSFLANLVAPVVVLAVSLVFALLQVLSAKAAEAETDNPKPKWAELFGLLRLLLVVGGVAINKILTVYGCIPVFVGIIGFAVGYCFYAEFTHPIVERVLVGLEQSCLLVLYSIFLWAPTYVASYDLDFYFTAIVFLLQLAFEIYKYVRVYKNMDGQDSAKVQDEESGIVKTNKKNSFGDSLDILDAPVQNNSSKRQLNEKITPPPPPPKKKVDAFETGPSAIKRRK